MRLHTESFVAATVTAIAIACIPVATYANGNIVISEFYTRGGNTGATLQNDYVQLFNRTSSTISLSGYSIQYASDAGLFTGGNNTYSFLSGAQIASNGFFLLKLNSNAAIGSTFTADVTNTPLGLGGAGGKFALVTNSISIDGISDPDIVDFVGYGTSNTREGSANAPAPSISQITRRNFTSTNYTDTNQNGANFTAIAISSGYQPGQIGSASPITSFQPVPAPPAAISLGIGGLVGLAGTGLRTLRSRAAKRKK